MTLATRVEITPDGYEAACTVVGDGVAETLFRDRWLLVDALESCGAMAGSDDAGTAWASSYDPAAHDVLDVLADVINGCYRFAALLQQTGFNYSRAELASRPGSVRIGTDRSAYADQYTTSAEVPSAAGGSSSPPTGWGLIAHAVGRLWPNGHQDRLRAAATAWTAMANALSDESFSILRALAGIEAQHSPEAADAATVCRSMSEHLRELGGVCGALARACSDYAAEIDQAHEAIEDELISLLKWTIAIEGLGLLAAGITLGWSEGAAQEGEATRIAVTAARIAALIDRLAASCRLAAEGISASSYRAAQISAALRPLLSSRLIVAMADTADALPAVRAAVRAETRLVKGAEAAKGPEFRISSKQFGHKIAKHARDYGLKPGDESAQAFLGRKINSIRSRPDEVRMGPWNPNGGGAIDYWFYRQGADVVVTKGNGDFVTILKGGQSNGWFLNATLQ